MIKRWWFKKHPDRPFLLIHRLRSTTPTLTNVSIRTLLHSLFAQYVHAWICMGNDMVNLLLRLWFHGPFIRFVKLQAAHGPGMSGTFFPPPRASDLDMHHGTCVTHVPWCMLGSLTSGFLWSRWWGKRSRHSRCMRNPQFFVSVWWEAHSHKQFRCVYYCL